MGRESRDVHDFHEVTLRDIGTLIVQQGEAESLTIEADDDVLSRILTTLRAGRLTIQARRLLFVRQPIVYRLTVKQLDTIELSGAANVEAGSLRADHFRLITSGAGAVTIEDLAAGSLEVAGSGSSHLELGGRVDRQRIRLSGADAYRAANLASREAAVVVDGSSQVTVRVSELLNVDVRGAASISYIGDPIVERRISGVGRLRQIKPEQRATA